MDSSKQFQVDRETKDLTRLIAEQINQADEKFEAGDSVFVGHEAAKSMMEARKARIRDRNKR